MKTIKARYNCGRWIWDCSICNSGNLISPGNVLAYCGGCYPKKLSRYEDISEKAKLQACANGDVYKITFPKNHAKIEAFLSSRRKNDRSWEVGETMKDLAIENKTHPDLRYLEDKAARKRKQKLMSETDAARVK